MTSPTNFEEWVIQNPAFLSNHQLMPYWNSIWMQSDEILPFYLDGEQLWVARSPDLTEIDVSKIQKNLQFYTGFQIQWVVVANLDLLAQLRQKALNQNIDLNKTSESSVKNWIHELLEEAVLKKVSDIHFEPYEDRYRIRFRLDGLLMEVASYPLNSQHRLVAYLKILSGLDTSERRLVQEGRFSFMTKNKIIIDCRVSICPTITGEKVVIRLLEKSAWYFSLKKLGLTENQYTQFLDVLSMPQGLILVTGPTGSGKTMTLYSALSYLNQETKNISTVEDPVEIKLSGINQININPKIGFNFPEIIKSLLRQDPDIIFIGEIRDLETAQMAIHAAQTGHLVLSTLHTNSAAETINRLVYLGIPWYQVASCLKCVIAQRLIRKRCLECNAGCLKCHKGYRGREGVFEALFINQDFETRLYEPITPFEINQWMQKNNMMTLKEAGYLKIKQKITTKEELSRVLGIR